MIGYTAVTNGRGGATYFPRGVRWDASGTTATELQSLGNGSIPADINDAGTVVGWSEKYNPLTGWYTRRAVRWDASGAVVELGSLPGDTAPGVESEATSVNNSGGAIGWGWNGLEYVPVRWSTSGVATELQDLASAQDPLGGTGFAYDLNDVSFAVGRAAKYSASGTFLGHRAVYWDLAGTITDLNALIDPASGWTLTGAYDISNTGWIAGTGTFDPDGAGGQSAYDRLFLMQVPTAVPEPGGLAILTFAGAALRRSGRRLT